VAADAGLQQRLRRVSLALFVVLAALIVTAARALLLTAGDERGVPAATLVGAALLVAGSYAALVNRGHAARAVVVTAALAGAVAAVDQLVTPLFQ
jgi:hypothetical protein